jgi:hypothetical protein
MEEMPGIRIWLFVGLSPCLLASSHLPYNQKDRQVGKPADLKENLGNFVQRNALLLSLYMMIRSTVIEFSTN